MIKPGTPMKVFFVYYVAVGLETFEVRTPVGGFDYPEDEYAANRILSAMLEEMTDDVFNRPLSVTEAWQDGKKILIRNSAIQMVHAEMEEEKNS